MKDLKFLDHVTHLKFEVPLRSPSEFLTSDKDHPQCLTVKKHFEYLTLTVNLETGQVTPPLKEASLQVYCKELGTYFFLKETRELARLKDTYVLDCLQVDERSYGDAIMMTIKDGFVENWPANSKHKLRRELEVDLEEECYDLTMIDTILEDMTRFLNEQGMIVVRKDMLEYAVGRVYDEFGDAYDPDHKDAERTMRVLRELEDLLGVRT